MVQKKKSDKTKNFDKEIKSCVETLLSLDQATRPKKNSLIDDGKNIFLQVSILKVPELNEFVKRRIVLKHPPYQEKPEVCLIVPDFVRKDGIKKAPDDMIDVTIEKYETLINKHNVTGITKIMPYLQLKTEYDTYELRRKLVNHFDIFLCGSYLLSKNNFFNCLGKIFFEKNKYPIPIKIPKLNAEPSSKFSDTVNQAIASTVYYIKPSSDNFSIKFGNTQNKKKDIIENLKIIVDKLVNCDDIVPGGYENIQAMNIKTERSKSIPLYMNLASRNDIPVPVFKSNVPIQESTEGEISTLPGKKVTVLPTGEVFVTRLKKSNFKHKRNYVENRKQEEKEDDDDDRTFDENPEIEKKDDENEEKNSKGNKKRKAPDSDMEDDDAETAIESLEQAYLANLNDESESEEEMVERKKSVIKVKGRKKERVRSKPMTKVKKEKLIKTKAKNKSDPKMRKPKKLKSK